MMPLSELSLLHFDDFLQSLCATELSIDLDAHVEIVSSDVMLEIRCNDVLLLSCSLRSGQHRFNIVHSVPHASECCLAFSMQGKSCHDTILQDGNIVQDTFVRIDRLRVNNFVISDDYDFLQQHCKYFCFDSNTLQETKMGFWSNACLSMNFRTPFDIWYSQHSTSNTKLRKSMEYRETAGLTEARDRFLRSLDLLIR